MKPRLLRKIIVAIALLPSLYASAQTYVTDIEDGHYYYIYTTQGSSSYIWPSTTTDAAGNPYVTEYNQKSYANYTDNIIKEPRDLDYTYSLWQFKKAEVNGRELWQIVNVALDRYMVWIAQSDLSPALRLEKEPSTDTNTWFAIQKVNKNNFRIYPVNSATGVQGNYTFDIKGGTKSTNLQQSATGGWHLVQFYNNVNILFEEETAYTATLADPTIEVSSDYTVTLACSTDGASIYYTTDGSEPSTSGTLYTAPFYMGHNTETLRAVSVKDGLVSHQSVYYAAHFAAPVITVSGTTVTLSSDKADAIIYYTTDGSEPKLDDEGKPTGSTKTYTAAFQADFSSVTTPVTVRAVAAKRGKGDISPESRHSNTITVTLSSQITNMGGNYILGSGFAVDKTGIGTEGEPFVGTIDGQRQIIATAIGEPLFGYVKDADIRGVVFQQVSIGGSGDVGALARKAKGHTRIYNCGVMGGSVSSTDGNCGSLVGSIEDYTRVVNCYSFASVGGGSTVGGIVGNNSFASTASDIRTLVAGCIFYGSIDGGSARYPVYGGTKISNVNTTIASEAINLYNYYRDEAITPEDLNDFNCAWPVEEMLLLRFEHLRSIMNSNRQLMAWYLTGSVADTALIDKWVLDPEVAPYPTLKRWGRYPSLVNLDPKRVWDATTGTWKQRSEANPWEGRLMGELEVVVSSGTSTKTITLPITDMDTLNADYCYAKVQLPYYNTLFGDPESADWNTRYGGNYTDRVVTGWKVTDVDKHGTHSFVAHWEYGYNFADRECTGKDIYDTSKRVFAQGGFYYVPKGVKKIWIEAYWGKAIYLHNINHTIDMVNDAETSPSVLPKHTASFNGRAVSIKLYDALGSMERTSNNPNVTVYDQAIVLVGNYQLKNSTGNQLSRDYDRPFTLMSVDLDMDEEPDYCFEAQWGWGSSRAIVNPVRFDFLAVPPLGLAMKKDGTLRRLNTGVLLPRGHFEITETSFIHLPEFEYDQRDNGTNNSEKTEAPLILNGGYIHRIVTSERMDKYTLTDRTLYIIMGGHFYCSAFTPGPHNDNHCNYRNRHCAVTVLGGEFPEFYLSGKYKGKDAPVNPDNPHGYVNGGRFGTLAGGGMERIEGNVTLEIEHALIGELYGGGMNAEAPITGNISVTVDHSHVGKYCGGPKYGNMSEGTNITTHATGTRFGSYFGGGDGGTNLALETSFENRAASYTNNTPNLYNWSLNNYTAGTHISNDRYSAQFEFDCYNIPSGSEEKNHNMRTYKYIASFAKTEVGDISSVLDSCEVMGDFYGAGNLGSVRGDVSSHLSNTTVLGSAFGAGFSASIPTFKVYSTSGLLTPYRDAKTGICHSEVMGDILTYTWSDGSDGSGVSAGHRNSNPELNPNVELNYLYTSPNNIKGLGQVGGSTTIVIDGNSSVWRNVYGGGNESAVVGDTKVLLSGNADVQGSVYGGGNIGTVGGNSKVEIK